MQTAADNFTSLDGERHSNIAVYSGVALPPRPCKPRRPQLPVAPLGPSLFCKFNGVAGTENSSFAKNWVTRPPSVACTVPPRPPSQKGGPCPPTSAWCRRLFCSTTASAPAMSPGMTATDVEIGHARQRRSPDSRAAIEYLLASGAVAIASILTYPPHVP